MQHSIAAKYAARPAASFIKPSSRDRERRLGLRPSLSFQPAAARMTVLHASRRGLQMSGWSPVTPALAAAPRSGIVRPAVAIHWAGLGRVRSNRRSSLAPAPWRA